MGGGLAGSLASSVVDLAAAVVVVFFSSEVVGTEVSVVFAVVSPGCFSVVWSALKGSLVGIWLGTAVGFGAWPLPPAAIASAAAGVDAAFAGIDVSEVFMDGGSGTTASSSQSISSSAKVVVDGCALGEGAALSLSDC